jgi:hypothetical protein
LVFIAALTLLTSCEDPIQIKLDEGSKLLVVDAFITDQRFDQKVRLTLSDSYFSGQNPPPVNGASVVLKDLTSGLSYTFPDAGNGNYIYTLGATDTIAFLNHTYQLEVTYEGHVYTAVALQKRTTKIDSISVKYEPQNAFLKEGYYASMWAFDVPGPEPDYYWIKSFRNDSLFNKGSQINIAIDGANGAGADGLIFTPPIAFGITPFGEVFHAYDKLRVEIHSVSKECFYFLRQVITQTTNSGLFATTPENVRTNISTPADAPTKAVGWFNMASVSTFTRSIP